MFSDDPIVPTVEKGLRDTPYRLFLSSATGYISIELFDRIMDAFIFWWTTTYPGVDCLLICDNLAIHKNKAIVDKIKRMGIHSLPIMPGSYHWFQVHDQEPFAVLKEKKMISSFYDIFCRSRYWSWVQVGTRYSKVLRCRDKAHCNHQSIQKACATPVEPRLSSGRIVENIPLPFSTPQTIMSLTSLQERLVSILQNRRLKLNAFAPLWSTPKTKEVKSREGGHMQMTSQSHNNQALVRKDQVPPLKRELPVAFELPTKRSKVMQMEVKTCAAIRCQKKPIFGRRNGDHQSLNRAEHQP